MKFADFLLILVYSLLLLLDLAEALESTQKQAHQGTPRHRAFQKGSTVTDLLVSLIHVYQDAQKAFHTLPPKSADATKAARFLRDTTENLIHYMTSIQPQDRPECLLAFDDCRHFQNPLAELRETFEWTNEFIERGLGGKKRAWEQSKGQKGQVRRLTQELDMNKSRHRKSNDWRIKQEGRCDPAPSMSCDLNKSSIGSHLCQEPVLPPHSTSRRRRRIDKAALCSQIHHQTVCRRSASPRSHRLKGKNLGLPDIYRPKYR